MRRKADPGNLGNPVHNMWLKSRDAPLYHRVPGDDKKMRTNTSLLDFWGAPADVAEIGYEALYPAPNAFRRNRGPYIGNVPEVSDILNGDPNLINPYSGDPRSYQYHGSDFLITGPYGDSEDTGADTYFYNNNIPVPRRYFNLPTDKMLTRKRRYPRRNWYSKYRRTPTLLTPNRKRTTNLWDWLGPSRGGNAPPSYGTEPQTGGGGPGLIRSSNEVDIMHKEATQQNPETISDIQSLVEKIKKHRGSMDYDHFSLLIEPLIGASKKYQFKYLGIVGLSRQLRTLSKKLQRNRDGRKVKALTRQIKQVTDEILHRIKSRQNTKLASTQNATPSGNWYEQFLGEK